MSFNQFCPVYERSSFFFFESSGSAGNPRKNFFSPYIFWFDWFETSNITGFCSCMTWKDGFSYTFYLRLIRKATLLLSGRHGGPTVEGLVSEQFFFRLLCCPVQYMWNFSNPWILHITLELSMQQFRSETIYRFGFQKYASFLNSEQIDFCFSWFIDRVDAIKIEWG